MARKYYTFTEKNTLVFCANVSGAHEHYTTLENPASNKHSSLLGPFVSNEE
jgi:hypothetical protein